MTGPAGIAKDKQLVKYFEGFDALRFIAAFLVVLHHAEQIRMTQGFENLKAYSLFRNGPLAVDFFFVLSGFLITYLLLRERYKTNTISIKQFYKRRILRIWPLYYLMVILGLLVVPLVLRKMGQDYNLPFDATTGWLLYVFFLPNAASSLFPPTGNLIYPLWSIGVEEQFYIVWAPLFKFVYKYILIILFGIIVGKLLLNEWLGQMAAYDESWVFWMKFIRTIKFESMSIGGLGALYLFKKGTNKMQGSFYFSWPFQILCISLLILHFTCREYIFDFDHFLSDLYRFFFQSKLTGILLSTLFLWLLLNTSINQQSLFRFRNKWLNRLGEISYGIYMYHIVIIYVVITLTKKWLQQSFMLSEMLFYGLMVPLLILVATISFQYFEKYFLALKE